MDIYRATGFTLVEAMITLVLASILLLIAVPGLSRLIEANGAYASSHELRTALNLARHHAITHNVPVITCRSPDQVACASSGRWDEGWLVFEDPAGLNSCADTDDDGRCDVGGGDILLRHSPANTRVEIVTNNNIRNRVRFGAMGMSRGYTGRFTFCGRENGALTGIVVPQTGRFRSARDHELLACP